MFQTTKQLSLPFSLHHFNSFPAHAELKSHPQPKNPSPAPKNPSPLTKARSLHRLEDVDPLTGQEANLCIGMKSKKLWHLWGEAFFDEPEI